MTNLTGGRNRPGTWLGNGCLVFSNLSSRSSFDRATGYGFPPPPQDNDLSNFPSPTIDFHRVLAKLASLETPAF